MGITGVIGESESDLFVLVDIYHYIIFPPLRIRKKDFVYLFHAMLVHDDDEILNVSNSKLLLNYRFY